MRRIFLVYNTAIYLLRFRSELAARLQELGWEVCAAVPLSDPASSVLKAHGIRCFDLPIADQTVNPVADLRMLLYLTRLFRREKAQAVINFTIKPVIYGSLAARLAGVPLIGSVITGLGYVFTSATVTRILLRQFAIALYRIALRFNRAVFFQNPDDQRYFVRAGVVSADRACLTNGSGVNLEQFPFVERRPEVRVFLLIARLLWDKGVREYVEAARIVGERHPDCEFWLLGPADANPAAIPMRQIEQWVKEGAIRYHGETQDVRPYLGRASVYVLPSYYREGTPHTVLEAMATGLPVITTDMPGCRETVRDAYNGYLVPARDVGALAERMLHLLANPSLVLEMGRRSRRLAEEKYDVHRVNARILAALGIHGEEGGA